MKKKMYLYTQKCKHKNVSTKMSLGEFPDGKIELLFPSGFNRLALPSPKLLALVSESLLIPNNGFSFYPSGMLNL